MKKFAIVIHYEGDMDYEVEAETEEEAIDIAYQMLGEEDEGDIAESVTDCYISKCSEL